MQLYFWGIELYSLTAKMLCQFFHTPLTHVRSHICISPQLAYAAVAVSVLLLFF